MSRCKAGHAWAGDHFCAPKRMALLLIHRTECGHSKAIPRSHTCMHFNPLLRTFQCSPAPPSSLQHPRQNQMRSIPGAKQHTGRVLKAEVYPGLLHTVPCSRVSSATAVMVGSFFIHIAPLRPFLHCMDLFSTSASTHFLRPSPGSCPG